MGLASLLLGVTGLVLMLGGFILGMVPGVGAVLSFGAPVLSLFGIVTGGVALSRAKQNGESGGLGVAGLVVSVIAFVLSLVVALTCGLCNACMTSSMVNQSRNGGFNWNPQGGNGSPPSQGSSGPSAWAPPAASAAPTPAALCAQALACCHEFAEGSGDAICQPTVEQARAQTDVGAACRELIAGWRGGFEQLGRPVPAECEAPSPAQGGSNQPGSIQGGACDDTCDFANDGECDDGRPGSQTTLCDPGTDCSDCGP